MAVRWISRLLAIALAAGCGSSKSKDPGAADGGTEPPPGEPDGGGDNQGTLPEVPAQAGVGYVVHYHDATLRSYRLDGEVPAAGPVVELGGVSHDLALDPENDLLAVASDVNREVILLRLSRPSGADADLAPPEVVGRVEIEGKPRFVHLHPYRQELYVVVAPDTDGLLTEMELRVYDVSDPARAEEAEASPQTVPVTVSVALDPVRDLLFLVAMTTDELHGYDLRDGGIEPLPGEPIDLLALYPQDNQFAFQARNLTADPFRNRLYAARAQSALSEVIAFEYPADIPRGGARYGEFAGMGDLVKVEDAFDVDLPPGERPNLLGGYQPAVDLSSGDLFLSADAWNGSTASALALGIAPDLSLRGNCDAFEGFGCWLRGHFEGEASTFLPTDGALCVDYTHRVVLATSVAPGSEGDPGRVHLFRYQEDLSMSPWLTEEGSDLAAGGLPIGAACH